MIRLRAAGLSYSKIINAIDHRYGVRLSKGQISEWVKGKHNPLGYYNKPRLKPLPELAALIGAALGDMSWYSKPRDHLYEIKLKVRDPDFAEEVNLAIAKVLGKSRPNKIYVGYESEKHRIFYRVTYGSRLLYEFLNKPWQEMKPFIEAYPREFLRFFFTAEGGVTISASGQQFRIWVYASNTDKQLLEYVLSLLKSLKINANKLQLANAAGSIINLWGSSYRSNKDCFRITISQLDDLKRFAELIGFSSRYKSIKLHDGLRIRERYESKIRTMKWNEIYCRINRRWLRLTD